MNSSFERIKALEDNADYEVKRADQAVFFRKKKVRKLCEDLRKGKHAIKVCQRALVSSRAAFHSVRNWRQELSDCQDILSNLKIMRTEAHVERYALRSALADMTARFNTKPNE